MTELITDFFQEFNRFFVSHRVALAECFSAISTGDELEKIIKE